MTRWTLEDLDRLIARARQARRPGAYLARLEAYRARLLAAQKDAADLVARQPAAGEVAPASVSTDMDQAVDSPPVAVAPVPDIAPLVERPVDLEELVNGTLEFWNGPGLKALKRKAGAGNLRALAQMATITRVLGDLDRQSRLGCNRPCCLPKKKSKPSGPVRVNWPSEGEKC